MLLSNIEYLHEKKVSLLSVYILLIRNFYCLFQSTGPYRGKMSSCYHAPCDTIEMVEPDFGFLSKITRTVVWVAADLALGYCGPVGVFSIPEMFQVAKERELINRGSKEALRPMVSIRGIMDILNYLKRINTGNIESSLNGLKHNSTKELLNTPLHRFRVPTDAKSDSSSPELTKLTISIHGANSTYLIPLSVAANTLPEDEAFSAKNESVLAKTSPNHLVRNSLEKNVTTSLEVV